MAQVGEAQRIDHQSGWFERSLRSDPATGLASRAVFDAVLEAECANDTDPVAVLILHVSGAATIRSRYGAEEADRLLNRAAAVVRAVSRNWDLAARFDDDDLAVVFPGFELEDALRVGRRIAHETERRNGLYVRGDPPLFFAFGAASGVGHSAKELTEAADPRRANIVPEMSASQPMDGADEDEGEGPSVA